MGYQFVTDLEGPFTLNDNAFELARDFLPGGEKLFSQMSAYDDYLYWVARRPGYQAGDTLKLIVPFLKASGLTDEGLRRFSSETLELMPEAAATLASIAEGMPVSIISTSYRPYVEAFCDSVGFPVARVFSTEMTLDTAELGRAERSELLRLAEEIAGLPPLEIPFEAGSPRLSSSALQVVARLDDIFWSDIPKMAVGTMTGDTHPVGARDKAAVVRKILRESESSVEEVFYVGDSITDCEALELVTKGGGLGLAFNGNRYAVAAAAMACTAGSARVMSVLARLFKRGGKDTVIGEAPKIAADSSLGDAKLAEVFESNQGELAEESELFRRSLRGRVGRLG
ncbi:MAG: hypothetical protein ACE5E0_05590 [Terriglobia bacterium]